MNTRPLNQYIRTHTGRMFWPMDARPEEVSIEDIAHALSNCCRWAGHCESFYSVAQHSVFVSSLLPAVCSLEGLLHDATEAYLVDVPRPVKVLLGGYVEAESRLMSVIADAFGLIMPISKDVKAADNLALFCERKELFHCGSAEEVLTQDASICAGSLGGIPSIGEPLRPREAKAAFMARFETLKR